MDHLICVRRRRNFVSCLRLLVGESLSGRPATSFVSLNGDGADYGAKELEPALSRRRPQRVQATDGLGPELGLKLGRININDNHQLADFRLAEMAAQSIDLSGRFRPSRRRGGGNFWAQIIWGARRNCSNFFICRQRLDKSNSLLAGHWPRKSSGQSNSSRSRWRWRRATCSKD